ncbi:hypothetical protein BD0036_15180 [Helicobacter pylori]
MVCLKAKIQKNNTTNKIKHAKTTTKKSNLKPQSLGKEKDLFENMADKRRVISKFYEQRRLQITFHRFRACKTKKLKITKHNPKNKQQH